MLDCHFLFRAQTDSCKLQTKIDEGRVDGLLLASVLFPELLHSADGDVVLRLQCLVKRSLSCAVPDMYEASSFQQHCPDSCLLAINGSLMKWCLLDVVFVVGVGFGLQEMLHVVHHTIFDGLVQGRLLENSVLLVDIGTCLQEGRH